MKTKSILTPLAALALATAAHAQLNIPSDGSDGDLVINEDTVIDLGQATPGQWNDNNAVHAGNGVYDSAKWAVVFKYKSVRIAGKMNDQGQWVGAILKFKNHPTHAPVVWLVQQSVRIDGILEVSGEGNHYGLAALTPSEPGPGGFRGGTLGPAGNGVGLGPGGAAGGGFYRAGLYASVYGNPQIIPLMGGSGGHWPGGAAAAGGGAIEIACVNEVTLNGRIDANGGIGDGNNPYFASGGAIKIIAAKVQGTGSLSALNDGRIRIESLNLEPTLRIAPETIAVRPGSPPVIWAPDTAPTARIATVDAVNAPADPTAPLLTQADIPIQNDNPVAIVVETRNFPLEGVVEVRIAEKFGGYRWERASRIEGGSRDLSTWQLSTKLAKGFNTLQVRATAP